MTKVGRRRNAARRNRNGQARPIAGIKFHASTGPQLPATNTNGIRRRDPKEFRKRKMEPPRRIPLRRLPAGDSTAGLVTFRAPLEAAMSRSISAEDSSSDSDFNSYKKLEDQFNSVLILLKSLRNACAIRYLQLGWNRPRGIEGSASETGRGFFNSSINPKPLATRGILPELPSKFLPKISETTLPREAFLGMVDTVWHLDIEWTKASRQRQRMDFVWIQDADSLK